MQPFEHFAPTYAAARARFLGLCEHAGLALREVPHPLTGRDGEALALDVARAGPGPEEARSVLLISSGCHGVEGFCGSGIQCALLADPRWHEEAGAAGIAVVYLHALNPWGFSMERRVTHENVDLNRNFLDFAQPLPRNAAYDGIARWLVPRRWPAPLATAALFAYAARRGRRSLQQALSGGQSQHPSGMFYSGAAPSWSHRVVREVVREHGRRCARLAWIDLHSGLGRRGRGEPILACNPDPVTIARARRWWGEKVRLTEDGTSVSARLSGTMWHVAADECPQAEFTGIALEFGTRSAWHVLQALRADHFLAAYGGAAGAAARQRIRRRMRAAFFVERDDWKAAVVAQGRQAVLQAVKGLAS
jgi:hypothetical protein